MGGNFFENRLSRQQRHHSGLPTGRRKSDGNDDRLLRQPLLPPFPRCGCGTGIECRPGQKVALLVGCRPEELIFTSGGTEANNLAVFGGTAAKRRAGRHIVTTAVEHASVAASVTELERQGCEVTPTDSRAGGADG